MKGASILIFASAAVFSTYAPAADAYKLYVNERYGYEIAYPADFIPLGVAPNGDGQVIESPGREAELRVFAETCFGAKETVGKFIASYVARERQHEITITYRHGGKEFAVVSGYEGNEVFYTKLLIDGDWCTEFTFKYPSARKTAYDPVATRIATSFKR